MPSADPVLRPQQPGDLPAVLDLTRRAFGAEGEVVAGLVETLATTPIYGTRFVVACEGERIIGHVGLTDGWIDAVERLVPVPVLSPLSVDPGHQGSGLGRLLVERALADAEAAGAPAVILEGDRAYYGRLGFEPAEARGVLRPSTAIPDRAFQWVRLSAYQPWMRGRFVYPDVFWRHDAVGLRDWRRQGSTGLEVSTVTLGARDVPALVAFYAALLGLEAPHVEAEDDWVALRETGGWSLAVQHEPEQEPATWPARTGHQHMQLHLEVRVDDLEAAVAHALSCGATPADHQPQDDVRVMLDPEGHPFCLWVETE